MATTTRRMTPTTTMPTLASSMSHVASRLMTPINESSIDLLDLNTSFYEGNFTPRRRMFGAMRYEDHFQLFLEHMNVYLMPVLIIIGIVGNTVSFIVFTFTYLRFNSSSVYLSVLSLSDTIYLVCLFFVWLPRVNVTSFHREGWCQANIYLMNVSQFISVWSVVCFTVERYILLCRPLIKDRWCQPRVALRASAIIALVPLIYFIRDFWTHGVHYVHTIALCMPVPRYYDLMTAMHIVDISCIFIIPFVIIIVFNIHVLKQMKTCQSGFKPELNGEGLRNHTPRRRPFFYTSVSRKGAMHVTFTSDRDEKLENGVPDTRCSMPCLYTTQSEQGSRIEHIGRSISRCQTARVLLVASTVFMCLALPNNIMRCRALIQELLAKGEHIDSMRAMQIKEFFELIYFINFAVDFFIYGTCSASFRKALKRFCSRVKRENIKKEVRLR